MTLSSKLLAELASVYLPKAEPVNRPNKMLSKISILPLNYQFGEKFQ